MNNWIENNKLDRPFEAGALAYVVGRDRNYGCHFGMRGTLAWCRHHFSNGWDQAQYDYRRNCGE